MRERDVHAVLEWVVAWDGEGRTVGRWMRPQWQAILASTCCGVDCCERGNDDQKS